MTDAPVPDGPDTPDGSATPDRFRVYSWDPRGGSAYTPPALVANPLGQVCFNRSFTAFGDCRSAG